MAEKSYALSLSGVTLAYASVLALCGMTDATDGLDSLGILSWKLARGTALVQGRILSVMIAAGMDFLVAALSVATVLLRTPRLTSFLAWAALVNGVFSFVAVTVWYMGVRLSLWTSFALAIPMIRVFASLANVQSAGGDGFEGKSYSRIRQVKDDAHVACSGEMRRLGNWSVGMTVGTASLVYSMLCLLLSMRDVTAYWSGRLEVITSSGPHLCLLIHGIIIGAAGIAGLLSIMSHWPSCALGSVVATILSLPISSCICIWWNVLWYRGIAMPGSTFFEANRVVEEQHWFLWVGPLGLFALLQLRRLQKKNLSGFESPDKAEEGEAESLVGQS